MNLNETTLDAPPDGLSHNELLMILDRQDSLASLKTDQEHEKLRVLMVDKYGEEGVELVERLIKEKRRKEK